MDNQLIPNFRFTDPEVVGLQKAMDIQGRLRDSGVTFPRPDYTKDPADVKLETIAMRSRDLEQEDQHMIKYRKLVKVFSSFSGLFL